MYKILTLLVLLPIIVLANSPLPTPQPSPLSTPYPTPRMVHDPSGSNAVVTNISTEQASIPSGIVLVVLFLLLVILTVMCIRNP